MGLIWFLRSTEGKDVLNYLDLSTVRTNFKHCMETFDADAIESSLFVEQDLKDRAADSMSAEDMMNFACKLEKGLPPFSQSNEWERTVSSPEIIEDIRGLLNTIEWLKLWAKYPVQIVPWY